MTRRLCCVLVILLCALLAAFAPAYAQSDQRVAVIVLLKPATLGDWISAPAPNLHGLMERGAVALMNTRAARIPGDRSRESVASAALTLGAGARAACDPRESVFSHSSSLIFSGVRASDLYKRRTEFQAFPNNLTALQWPRILGANNTVGYHVAPGSLGGSLRNVGVNVCAVNGFAAPLVAADQEGAVAACSANPFYSLAAGNGAAFFIDAPADWRAADRLVSEAILFSKRYGGRLIVVSPTVDDREYAAGNRLAPIVITGPEIKTGLLTSRSTRTPGLIANTDFAGFVAGYFGADWRNARRYFGMPPASADFRRASDFAVLPSSQPLKTLESIDLKAMAQHQGMKVLPYFAVVAGLLIVAITILKMRGVVVPSAVILLPALAIFTFVMAENVREIFFFGIAPIGLLLSLRSAEGLRVLRWTCAVIWLAAIIHMLAPHGLLKFSLLGYSMNEGARYYGIGNEMMGALAGAVLVTATGAKSNWARRMMLVLVLATVSMVGWPQIGAKAGGVIVSVGTLLVYFGTLRGVQWRVSTVAIVVTVALAAVLAVAFFDSQLNPGRQSHLGQAVMGLQQSGGSEWMDIVTRKLAVEGRLLWRSAWALLLWGALAGMIVLRRRFDVAENLERRAFYNAGIAAILLSMAFNDAGAVAGALCATLLWSALSLKTTGSENDPRSSSEPVSA